MQSEPLHVVTGAFGYTGKYITRRLLDRGIRVRTLTGHPDRPNQFGGKVETAPFNFDEPSALAESLRGVDVLYNTYWVRFTHDDTTFSQAVGNTQMLFSAAKVAGVKRIVHVSITQPSLDSPLPYFSGKARLEDDLKSTGIPYAIIRPTVIFGKEDILINNVAWLTRSFPFFAIPGDGKYRLQPIYVEDMADLAVDCGLRTDNITLDAVGPEVFTFIDLVRLIAKTIGKCPFLIPFPPMAALALSQIAGRFVGDVILTREEVYGLMANLLISDAPPTGKTSLTAWLEENKEKVGIEYHSEIKRHY